MATTKKVSSSARIINLVKEGEISADQANRTREGRVIIRRGFFITRGHTAEQFAAEVRDSLSHLMEGFKVTGCGEVHLPFNGSAPVQKQSHWWVEVAAAEAEAQS